MSWKKYLYIYPPVQSAIEDDLLEEMTYRGASVGTEERDEFEGDVPIQINVWTFVHFGICLNNVVVVRICPLE